VLIKVVIDTNIYISAIFWGGKPRKIIDLGRDGKVLILTSSDITKEIAEKLQTRFKLDKEEVRQILLDLSSFTIPIHVTRQIQAVYDDPDDDKFIECAVSGNADYIVSGDRHLLQLKEYSDIKILKASEFLGLVNEEE